MCVCISISPPCMSVLQQTIKWNVTPGLFRRCRNDTLMSRVISSHAFCFLRKCHGENVSGVVVQRGQQQQLCTIGRRRRVSGPEWAPEPEPGSAAYMDIMTKTQTMRLFIVSYSLLHNRLTDRIVAVKSQYSLACSVLRLVLLNLLDVWLLAELSTR